MKKKYKIVKRGFFMNNEGIVRNMYRGVYAAAKGIKVRPQTIYDYLNGRKSAIGEDKRSLLVVVE